MIFNSVEEFVQAVIAGHNEIDIQDYIVETFDKGGLARLEKLHLTLLVEYVAANGMVVYGNDSTPETLPRLNDAQLSHIMKALDLMEETIEKFKSAYSTQADEDESTQNNKETNDNENFFESLSSEAKSVFSSDFFNSYLEECFDNARMAELFTFIFNKIKENYHYNYNDKSETYYLANAEIVRHYITCASFILGFLIGIFKFDKLLLYRKKIVPIDLVSFFNNIPKICTTHKSYRDALKIHKLVIQSLSDCKDLIVKFERQWHSKSPNEKEDLVLCFQTSVNMDMIKHTYNQIKAIVDDKGKNKVYTIKDIYYHGVSFDIGLTIKKLHDFITAENLLNLAKKIRHDFDLNYFTKALDIDFIKTNSELTNQFQVALYWLDKIIKWHEKRTNGVPMEEVKEFVNQIINEHLQAEPPITISQNSPSIEANNNSPTNITNDSPNHQMSTKEFFDKINKEIFVDVKLKTILEDAVSKGFIGKKDKRYIWASDKYLIVKKVDFGRFIHEAFSKCCKDGYTINGNFPEDLINDYFNISSIGSSINQASSNTPKRYKIVKLFLENY